MSSFIILIDHKGVSKVVKRSDVRRVSGSVIHFNGVQKNTPITMKEGTKEIFDLFFSTGAFIFLQAYAGDTIVKKSDIRRVHEVNGNTFVCFNGTKSYPLQVAMSVDKFYYTFLE